MFLLKFSRSELAVLSLLMAIALIALGYHLATTSKKEVGATSAGITYTPAPLAHSAKQQAASAAPAAKAASFRVYVTGAVKKPGCYTLPTDLRVEDAIRAAGGFTPKAKADSVNLAAPLKDGMQIDVKEISIPASEPQAPARTLPMPGSNLLTPGIPAGSPSVSSKQIVSINSGTLEQLDSLPGIGPAIAQRIIDYRLRNGGFKHIDDLQNVPGIGPSKLEQVRPYVSL